MGCCKCEQYAWPDPQRPVWTHPSGREYCNYHAPLEHKTWDEDNFREDFLERIYDYNILHYTFEGASFPYPINFLKLHQTLNINFNRTTFTGLADFSDQTFIGKTSFIHSTFLHGAHFDRTIFDCTCHFSMSRFLNNDLGNKAYFTQARFRSIAFFHDTLFEIEANFNYSSFLKRASFANTIFSKKDTDSSSFGGVKFEGHTHFSNCLFYNGVDFFKSQFNDESYFETVTFSIPDSQINENATRFDMIEVNGSLVFSTCSFRGQATFRDIVNIKKIIFKNSELTDCDFLNTPLTHIIFQSSEWKINNELKRYKISAENDDSRLDSVIVFYRAMKKRTRDEQNDTEASHWHHAEKDAQLKFHRTVNPWSFQRWMLEIYRVISRYGEDPWQACKIFFILMALLALATGIGALYLHSFSPDAVTWERTGKFALTFSQYALLVTPTYTLPSGFAAAALLLSRLLIPIQAAILAFAIRNKLHR